MRELRKIIRKQNSANWHQVFTGCGLLRVILHHPDGGSAGTETPEPVSVIMSGAHILTTSEELRAGSGKKMLLKVRECQRVMCDRLLTFK